MYIILPHHIYIYIGWSKNHKTFKKFSFFFLFLPPFSFSLSLSSPSPLSLSPLSHFVSPHWLLTFFLTFFPRSSLSSFFFFLLFFFPLLNLRFLLSYLSFPATSSSSFYFTLHIFYFLLLVILLLLPYPCSPNLIPLRVSSQLQMDKVPLIEDLHVGKWMNAIR